MSVVVQFINTCHYRPLLKACEHFDFYRYFLRVEKLSLEWVHQHIHNTKPKTQVRVQASPTSLNCYGMPLKGGISACSLNAYLIQLL